MIPFIFRKSVCRLLYPASLFSSRVSYSELHFPIQNKNFNSSFRVVFSRCQNSARTLQATLGQFQAKERFQKFRSYLERLATFLRHLRGGYTPIMGKKFKLVLELSYLDMLQIYQNATTFKWDILLGNQRLPWKRPPQQRKQLK